MRIAGLITEYNPFHNGHAYHLEQVKKHLGFDGVVVIMSGNFVQRGTPALLDKWTRTDMALRGGADLVIELPAVYASASAEIFALGAVRILNGLNCVEQIIFGSESGDISELKETALLLHKESPAYKDALKLELSAGHAFPVARARAIASHFGKSESPSLPNDILGMEYIKAGLRMNSPLKFDTIKRISSNYHDTDIDTAFSSATAVRKAFFEGRQDEARLAVPKSTYELLIRNSANIVSSEALYPFIMYKLRTESHASLSRIQDMNEGLEHRIKDAADRAQSYEDLVDLIKTKRYVRTRIQRVLLNTLLGVETDFVTQAVQSEHAAYARVLGFNDTGRKIMKQMRKSAEIPIITNVNKHVPTQEIALDMLALDMRATDFYTLLNGTGTGAQDKLMRPVHHKNDRI